MSGSGGLAMFRLRQCSRMVFSFFFVLLASVPALSQIIPARITLYSPQKYRLANAPSMSNGQQPPDFSRATIDFRRGDHLVHGGDLSYGNLQRDGADWFLLENGSQSRSVIKDLGGLDWVDRFDVPSITPLPELPLDQGRLLKFDTSGRNAKERGPISNLPNVAKVILGHMYAIRVVDLNSDFYVLVHVDALVVGDNCAISWKILS